MRHACDRCGMWINNCYCAPAQEEKEEMRRNDKGQMICDHCREPITLSGAGETWVNADPKAYHRKCYSKAVTDPAEHKAARDAIWERAYFATLPSTTAHYLPHGRLQAAIIDSGTLANETVARWDEMRGEKA